MKAVFQNKVLAASLTLASLLTNTACAAQQTSQRPVPTLASEAKQAFEAPKDEGRIFTPLENGCYEVRRAPKTPGGVMIAPQIICPQAPQ